MGDDALWLIVTAGEARLWQTRLSGTFVAVDYVPVDGPD